MASSSTDTKANTQTAEHAEPTVEAKQNAVTEAPPVPSSAPSVFVNSEPIREDQVENAVKFLSHPKVRGSPVMYRRSFLEKKGLTREEIDEAFRRVPDPTPTVQAATISQDAQSKPQHISSQPQAALQAGQPLAAVPSGGMKTVSGYRFHWTHAAYAIGLLAASGAGSVVIFKKSILPRLKSWVRQVVEEEENPSKAKPSLTEEAAAAAKAASAAALEMSKASQELVNMKIEEKKKFEEITSLFDSQLQEIKSMRSAVTKLEGQPNTYNPVPYSQDTRGYGTNSRSYVNGRTEYDYHSARTASPPPPVAPSSTLHPKSYMEDINDASTNPHHGMSDSRIAPKSKPWEGSQTRTPPNQYYHSDAAEGWNYNSQDSSMPLDWQRRNPSTTEVDYNNASSFRTAEKVTVQQRPWAPPGTPPISLAGAEEAIRRPKQSIQKDQVYSDGSQAAVAADATSDELQRVTRMSESGGGNLPEMNGGNSVMNSIEIQEEQESY